MTQARTLVRMQFGSHVYGTNVPTSDLDFKAIHVPAAADILLQRVRPSINNGKKKDDGQKNGPDDVDFESFALQKFMAMLLEGQTVALSMLFTPEQWIIEQSPEWAFIRSNRQRWLHRSVSAFAGYCRQQANKYGIRGSRVAASRAVLTWAEAMVNAHGTQGKLRDHWPEVEELTTRGLEHVAIVEGTHADSQPVRFLEVCNRKIQEHATFKEAYAISKRVFDEYGQRALLAETNQGVDWKACMHAVRVSREAEELLLHHTITYPRPEADLLLAIRKGELPYKDVAEMLETGLDRLEECHRISTLPDRGDQAGAEAFVIDVYRKAVASTEREAGWVPPIAVVHTAFCEGFDQGTQNWRHGMGDTLKRHECWEESDIRKMFLSQDDNRRRG